MESVLKTEVESVGIGGPANWLERFAGYYCLGDLEFPAADFHRVVFADLCNEDLKRVVIAAPRYHAKSTIAVKLFTLGCICYRRVSKILILSATSSLSVDWLRNIKTELETNPFILADFGVLKSDKWAEDHFIANGVEVMGKGRGYQIRGFHPDIVICDDLEDEEEVRSDEQREKLSDWFNKSVINTLGTKERLMMIGTILHPQSLLSDVLERDGYRSHKWGVDLENDVIPWPEKWPKEALIKRRMEIGAKAFSTEFENRPIIQENPIFLKHWFQGYEKKSAKFEGMKRGLYVVTAIDPAISKKEGSDYTAIVTFGATYSKKPDYYCLDVRRGHWTLQQQIDELVRVFGDWHQTKTIVETTAYQQALFDECSRLWDMRHIDIRPFEVKPDKDKERRANVTTPLFQEARVYFDLTEDNQVKLMEECLLFPTGTHDDMVDAMAYCLNDMRDWSGTSSGEVTVKNSEGVKDPFTGW